MAKGTGKRKTLKSDPVDRFRIVVVEPGGFADSGEFGVSVAGIRADKTMASSRAKSGRFGVAIGPWNGTAVVETGPGGIATTGKSKSVQDASLARAGGGGMAAANDGGFAIAGDGGMAFARGPNGNAEAAVWGTAQCNGAGSKAVADFQGNALIQEGSATAGTYGLASVRRKGVGKVGKGGVVILWNHGNRIPDEIVDPYPDLGTGPRDDGADRFKGLAAAGRNGVIIAFFEDENGERVPVIGLVGKARRGPVRIQSGLSVGIAYSLNAEGKLAPVKPDGKKHPRPKPRKGSKT